jgi:uncharacterized protein (TIGR02596 family)
MDTNGHEWVECGLRQCRLRSRRALSGFTLLELILVLVIAALLVTLGTLSFQGTLSSQKINAASYQLSGDLTQAAQLAITRNQTIAVVFLKEKDLLDDEKAQAQFRGWQLQGVNPQTGVLEPVGEPTRLDAGIIFMDHAEYSSILHRPRTGEEPWVIRFKPGGGTDLPTGPNQHWCLTLALESDVKKDANALPLSSRTLVVNGHTGMVTGY